MTNENAAESTDESLEKLWKAEYHTSGIPSSFRTEPSGAVSEFVEYIRGFGVTSGNAVDLGCGRGRNSLYLASVGFEVSAVDLVKSNVESLRSQAMQDGLADKITAAQVDLNNRWPFEDSAFDIAIDTFVYKHQAQPGQAGRYRDHLYRVLKPGAFYLITLAGLDDGYYGQFLDGNNRASRYIVDPANGIPSLLYTYAHVRQDFSEELDLLHFEHKQKTGEMHGGTYNRSTLVFFFQKR